MTKTTALTESFAAGEITPLLSGRVSSEGYKQGVKSLLNMVTDPRGALVRRPGFLTRGTISNKMEAAKATFRRSKNDNYDLVLTDLLLTISPNSSQRLGVETVENGKFLKGDTGWDTSTSHANASVVFDEKTGLCTMTPGIVVGEDAVIRRPITIETPSVNHKLELFGVLTGPSASEGLDLEIGTALGLSDILNTTAYDPTKYLTDTIAVGVSTRLYLQITVKAQDSRSAVSEVTPTYLSKITMRELITTAATTTVVTPYLEADVNEVHKNMAPDGLDMYFTHSDYPPQKLNYNPGTGVWTFAPVVFVATPVEWVANNYPSTMTFFQGRSWWGGLPDNEETFWASKSGFPEDLTVGILAADAFKLKIAKAGLIKWIIGSKNLLIGTDNSEHIITSEGGLITPTDNNIDQQSAFGSSGVQPAELGTEVLYVSPDGKKLRTMGYSWTDSGWISQDLTEASEHITKDPIVSLAFARNPDSIIWMTTASGGLISCAYRKVGGTTSVIGWHRHKLNGAILDVSTIEDEGNSYVFIAIRRLIAGEPIITFEQSTPKESEILTDGSVISAATLPRTVITGLAHLEGQIVRPVVDGSVHSLLTVVGGQVTLTDPAYYVTVGTHTSPIVTTLALVLYGQGLPMLFGPKRWPKIYLAIIDSAMPLIEGTRPPDRDPSTPMGIPEPLISDLVPVSQLGWETKGEITIEQDLPLPLTIVALTGEAKHNTL